MRDAKRFPISAAALAAFFGVIGYGATVAGCVMADLPAGSATVVNDGLGGGGGMPSFSSAGAADGAGGEPRREWASHDAGAEFIAGAPPPRGDGQDGQRTFSRESVKGESEPGRTGELSESSFVDPGGAECVTKDGAPYLAKSC